MSGLELCQLSKAYGSLAALDDVDLDVPPGSRTAIVGPSGCGKTTLLRLIVGFEPPDAGRIRLDGRILADGAAGLPAYRRGVGIVMQDGALFPHLSIADNVGFGLARHAPGRAKTIAGLMDLVGLPRAMLDQRPDQLSGGQQQRVALARALAREPRLMLLDEPFSALDTGLRAATREAVADLLGSKRITTILVTHDQAEALSFADQVAVMQDGRFRQVGSPRDLYLRPRDASVAAFLGSAILLRASIAHGFAECALGTLPVADTGRTGEALVMLRPEQVRITVLDPASTKDGVVGEVLGIGFDPGCTALVRLPGLPDLAPMSLSISTDPMPDVGDPVAVTVSGTAHVLRD